MGLTILLWLAVIVLVAVAIVKLWPRATDFTSAEPDRDNALSLLRDRYARGEITKAEFLDQLRDLTPKL